MPDVDHHKRNRVLVALLPLGILAFAIGSLFLIYSLASSSNAGDDPSPLPLPFVPIAAVLLAAGVGAVLWAVLSRRRGR